MPGWRLEAHHRLRRPERAHIVAQLTVAPGIAGGPALGEKPGRLQGRKFGQPGLDQRLVGLEPGRDHRPRVMAGLNGLDRLIEQAAGDPAVQGRAADAGAASRLEARATALGEKMSE